MIITYGFIRTKRRGTFRSDNGLEMPFIEVSKCRGRGENNWAEGSRGVKAYRQDI